ncbi:MAG: hypothetical protein ACLRSW_00590 [Christensenellaceae bacterium]
MFAWAEGLERVTLGADTKTLASYTFWYCLSLTTVNVSGQKLWRGCGYSRRGDGDCFKSVRLYGDQTGVYPEYRNRHRQQRVYKLLRP